MKKIVKSLKITITDKNTLPVRILKILADIFSPVLANHSNKCFIRGVFFSESLDIASITPTFKKGDAKLTSNCRPICSLSYISKILGKLMHSRLIAYLNKNQLLDE